MAARMDWARPIARVTDDSLPNGALSGRSSVPVYGANTSMSPSSPRHARAAQRAGGSGAAGRGDQAAQDADAEDRLVDHGDLRVPGDDRHERRPQGHDGQVDAAG